MAPFDFKENCVAKTSCTSWKALGLTYPPNPKHLEERKSSPVTLHGNFPQKGEVFCKFRTVFALSHLFGLLFRKQWLEQRQARRTLRCPCCKSDLSICIWLHKFASKIQVSVHGREQDSNMEALTTVNH